MRSIVVQTNQELNQCLDIRRDVFIIEQCVPEDLEVDEWDVVGRLSHILVYDEGNVPIATARLMPYMEGTAKIQRVAVRKTARGKGYGAFIMEALEKLACEQNFRHIVLDAQCHAEHFYKKIGYITVSEKFLEAGIEHVRMEKVFADK